MLRLLAAARQLHEVSMTMTAREALMKVAEELAALSSMEPDQRAIAMRAILALRDALPQEPKLTYGQDIPMGVYIEPTPASGKEAAQSSTGEPRLDKLIENWGPYQIIRDFGMALKAIEKMYGDCAASDRPRFNVGLQCASDAARNVLDENREHLIPPEPLRSASSATGTTTRADTSPQRSRRRTFAQ